MLMLSDFLQTIVTFTSLLGRLRKYTRIMDCNDLMSCSYLVREVAIQVCDI
jgi:hypothetical protein